MRQPWGLSIPPKKNWVAVKTLADSLDSDSFAYHIFGVHSNSLFFWSSLGQTYICVKVRLHWKIPFKFTLITFIYKWLPVSTTWTDYKSSIKYFFWCFFFHKWHKHIWNSRYSEMPTFTNCLILRHWLLRSRSTFAHVSYFV